MAGNARMSQFEAVSFLNDAGYRLHGMLHAPDPALARGICILMLSPGIKGRVGPHRLYLKLAERLVPMGFHLLRFDFHGLGDSEGELTEDVMADMYNTIQGGRYVDDTIAAMQWMQSMHGIRHFVGSGLCGGSITALLAAAKDRRIESLLGIGLPVILDGGAANWGRFLTQQQRMQAKHGFFARLLRPQSWWNVVSGRANYRVIWRILLQVFGYNRKAGTTAHSAAAALPVDDTNPLFAPAFFELIDSNRPALLIYSGADRLQSQFEEKFEARHRDRVSRERCGYSLHTISQANHIMSAPDWVAELCDVSAKWLEQFPRL
jgi:pimeloyl-ACP methyl ester carboxylesterase